MVCLPSASFIPKFKPRLNRPFLATVGTEPGVDFLGGPEDLPGLLAASDYFVVACPLTPVTEGLIGKEQFALMKPDSFLINVSRGEIIQERALYEALRSGRIAGAALDVLIDPNPATRSSNAHSSARVSAIHNNVLPRNVAGGVRS
ncbi:MAG: NAD(P)-dependent oxidoreductase [Acidobacteriota bacterium]|nr:NAD(P)-dependent oxidoreductase [Acidobacteriota bacterium]